jgi:uncharacterized integral membrane protein
VADDTKSRGRDTGSIVRLGVAAVLVIAAIAFVVDNFDKVKVGFVFKDASVPLIWVLLATLILGVILDRLWQYSRRH